MLEIKSDGKVYAKWLTTMEGVNKNYLTDDFEIQEYSLPDKYLIGSDLGASGILILTDKMLEMEGTYVKA
jgi:hypothetical protein